MNYKSKLGPYIEGLVNEKHAMGFSFELQESNLRRFDTLVFSSNLDYGAIDEKVIELWETRFPSEGDIARNARLRDIDMLACFIEQLGMQASHPSTYGNSKHSIPYIPSEAEISSFFSFVDNMRQRGACRWDRLNIEYSILFRLYYLCGLRLNEPLRLKKSDVNPKAGTLYIRHSKGDQDRIVHVSNDLAELLDRYDIKMKTFFLSDREWYFPGFYMEKPFQKTSLDRKFRELWMAAFPEWHVKRPTIHSLRHSFVVHRINHWASIGKDFGVMVPVLKTYLGHSSIDETYYYYHMLDPRSKPIRNKMEECSLAGGFEK